MSADVLIDEIELWFDPDPPGLPPEDKDAFTAMATKAKALAYAVLENTPRNTDQSLAIREIRTVLSTAYCSILTGKLR